jgi:HAD superfamily hydrolase (TIGR01509 family)
MAAEHSCGNHAIELVCFDLGRVLLRIRSSWVEACEAAGVAVPEAARDPQTLERMAELRRQAEHGAIDAEGFAAETARVFNVTPDDVLAASAAWLCGPYPGVEALLDDVLAADVRTACLSNTNDHHWRLLATPGDANNLAWDRLDWQFASHLVGHAKPAPEMYAHLERVTGVAPRRILFFDDMPQNCTAAAARGWQVQRIDPAGDPAAVMRGYLVAKGVLGSRV